MDKQNTGQVKWNHMASNDGEKKDAGPKYSRFSESLRHATPGVLQCSMFCGGRQCKYENPGKFKSKEMAIQGLYSSWVTEDILATARPSSEIIKNHKIIEQFKQNGIKSIINLQHPEEHSSCGYGLQESGFSYEPEEFMQQEIFYYNFGWNDYGVRSLESILDMVKVMSFALQEGKAAVHCHAGLGRTGVLVSCYLVYSRRVGAEEAIHLMRKNRPKAVQTRGQIECVKNFYDFLQHLWVVFPSCHPDLKRFSLQHYLIRQKHLLHGMEARELKNLPKIVCVACSRLLELANVKEEDANMKWTLTIDTKRKFSEPEDQDEPDSPTIKTIQQDNENSSNNLKHNPYVEVELVRKDNLEALQRSHSIDDIIGTDSRLVSPSSLRMPVMHERSRAQSEPDIFQNTPLVAEARQQSPSTTGSIHGIRLKPLNAKKSKEKKTEDECSDMLDEVEQSKTQSTAENIPTPPKTPVSVSQEDRNLVAKALGTSACVDAGIQNKTEKLKRKINNSDAGWDELKIESDPWVLSRLLWTWLEGLEEPVLSESDIDCLSSEADPIAAAKNLKKGEKGTLECLMTTVSELEPLPEHLEERVLRRISIVLTQNRQLPLTSPRASLERMASTSSTTDPEDEQNTLQGEVDESPFDDNDHCSSVISSPSYRLLVFLRSLLRTLKGQLAPT